MMLKLVEAGKFTGLKKTSEIDLTDHPQELQEHVKKIFSETHAPLPHPLVVPSDKPKFEPRDKENYKIEYNGKILPLDSILPNKELQGLIYKLKIELHH